MWFCLFLVNNVMPRCRQLKDVQNSVINLTDELHHTHEDNCEQIQELRNDINELKLAQNEARFRGSKDGSEKQDNPSDLSMVDSEGNADDENGNSMFRLRKSHQRNSKRHVSVWLSLVCNM